MRPARRPMRRLFAVALTAVLTAGLMLTGLPAQAVDAMVIHGTVTGPGGAPVPGAYVTIIGADGTSGFGADASGQYSYPVPAGTYRVQVSGGTGELAPEYYDNASTLADATPITVAEGQVLGPTDVQLAVGGRIEGHLTGPGGVAVPNLVVQVYRHNPASVADEWQIMGGVFANTSTGAYAVEGLPDGDYRVHFNDQSNPRKYFNEIYDDNVQSLVTVAGAAVVSGIDGELAEGGHITGKITGGGVGLAYARATAYDATTGHQVAQATTDNQGNYDVRGLPTGTYKVEFQPNNGTYLSEFYSHALDLAGAHPVAVTAGATTPLPDAALAAASKITGRVLGVDGLPLENVRVTKIPVIDGSADDIKGGYHAQTDANGVYTVLGLRAGTYRLAFHKPDSAYSLEYFPDQDTAATAQDVVVVGAGETKEVADATLDLAGSITGQLTSPAGSTPRVILHRRYGEAWRMIDTWVPDSAGVFEMLQLRAGTFRVEFKDLVTGTSRYYNGAKTFGEATDITIAPGAVATGVNGTLIDPVVSPSPSPSPTPSETSSPTPTSSPTASPAPLRALAATTLPVIKGKATVGRALRVTAGAWNAPSATLVRQWLANGKVIKKATKARLTLTRALIGKKITVRITVSAPGYTTLVLKTRPSARVRA